MNLCVVSTFDCTVADFKAMVEEFREDMLKVCSEWEISEVNEHKAVTLVNVTDMDGFQELMTSPAVVEWDTANNTVDVIYSLEQMG
mgnify:FL=1|tara:strand:- start:203 stop:460 length:258 start_codon:yes stop_codon:yes gene_type:complete